MNPLKSSPGNFGKQTSARGRRHVVCCRRFWAGLHVERARGCKWLLRRSPSRQRSEIGDTPQARLLAEHGRDRIRLAHTSAPLPIPKRETLQTVIERWIQDAADDDAASMGVSPPTTPASNSNGFIRRSAAEETRVKLSLTLEPQFQEIPIGLLPLDDYAWEVSDNLATSAFLGSNRR